MPHGLPSATTTNRFTIGRDGDKKTELPKGSHVEPKGIAANQDGFTGHHVWCIFNNEWMAIEKDALNL